MERTVCACPDCVACCKKQPGPLVPSDIKRLRALGLTLTRWLGASRGGVYGTRARNGEVRLVRVPTITPRHKGGRCVFLDARDRCSIHEVAPFGCAYFDTHMPADEAQRRSIHMATLQTDVGYQRMRATLGPARED